MLKDSHHVSNVCGKCNRKKADPELEEWRRQFLADHDSLQLEAGNFGLHSVHSTMKSIGHGISHLKGRITGKKASKSKTDTGVETASKTQKDEASDASDSSDVSDSSDSSDASDSESEDGDSESEKGASPVKTSKTTAESTDASDDSSDDDGTSEDASEKAENASGKQTVKSAKYINSKNEVVEEANDSDAEDDDTDVKEGAGIGKSIGNGIKRGVGAVGSGLSGVGSILSEVPNHIGHGLLALSSAGDEPAFDDSTTDDDDDDDVQEGAGIGNTMRNGFKRGVRAVGSGLAGVGSILYEVPNHIGHGLLALSAGGDEPVFDRHVHSLLTDKYGPGLPSSSTFLNSKRLTAKRREMYFQREYDAAKLSAVESYHNHDSMYTRPYDKDRYTGRYDPMPYTGTYVPEDYAVRYNPARYSGAYDARLYSEAYNTLHHKKVPALLPSYQRSSATFTKSPNATYGVIR